MKITVEVNNLAKSPIKKAVFQAVAKKTLEKSGYHFLNPLRQPADGGKNICVSLAVVGPAKIKKLNKIYLKQNEPTDILSFAEYKNIKKIQQAMTNPPAGGLFLGELILCYDDVKEYAKIRGLVLKKELAVVFAHGLLHLLGFRHGKKMFEVQDKMTKVF